MSLKMFSVYGSLFKSVRLSSLPTLNRFSCQRHFMNGSRYNRDCRLLPRVGIAIKIPSHRLQSVTLLCLRQKTFRGVACSVCFRNFPFGTSEPIQKFSTSARLYASPVPFVLLLVIKALQRIIPIIVGR